jgi:hypothetical protein
MTTPTTQNPRKQAFLNELVTQLRNEDLHFNMAYWTTGLFGDESSPPSCETASCLAGHIEALRRDRALELAKTVPSHSERAKRIYEEETGEPCRLDFYGVTAVDPDGDPEDDYPAFYRLEDIPRDAAIAHVLGANPDWPQLEPNHDEY